MGTQGKNVLVSLIGLEDVNPEIGYFYRLGWGK